MSPTSREAFAPPAAVLALLNARIDREFTEDERRFVLNEPLARLRGWIHDTFSFNVGS